MSTSTHGGATLPRTAVVGIDVGGQRKGFHAVELSDRLLASAASADPNEIVDWCLQRKAEVIAVDAPCRWSKTGGSRLAERQLGIGGAKIHCFATPTRAVASRSRFYDWVFNGERLYERLARHYVLFDGDRRKGPICFETFPHGIACALAGRVVPAKPKIANRRAVLRGLRYEDRALRNVDFVDAALCAVAAEGFRLGRVMEFGDREEGFIVVPAS